MKILPTLYESKRAVLGIDPSTSGWNRVYLGMGNHLMVADSLRTMQRTVVKRFIHYKHNIILWNTQVFSRKVVTFFEDCKSWSHSSLFVWDWNCRARRIASNFTRFYRIAKCVTRRIWLDSHPKTQHRTNIKEIDVAKQQVPPFDKGGFRGNVNTDSRKKESR